MTTNETASEHRVLLGVTGGIAAYKSADLVRRLREAGAEVRVVMTRGAQQFVSALTFQAVSGHRVHADLLDAEAEAGMGHIELARWADRVLVAPATAHFMARMAAGTADDLLTTVCLATAAPVYLAPAMNQGMWRHPGTRDNARTLADRGITLLGPGEGSQACGDQGPGRMLEPAELVRALFPGGPGPLAGRRVLVTAGPTHEAIDAVRYIANRSSGKMGFAVARACREAGAEVTLVTGPVALPAPEGVERIDVVSAAEMHAAVMDRIAGIDLLFGVAAVADWTVAEPAAGKLKKGDGAPRIELTRATDIIAAVASLEARPYIVGFAAETDDPVGYARAKLADKGIDAIAVNDVGREDIGFGADDNELVLLTAGEEASLGRASKRQLARELVRRVAPLADRRHARSQGGEQQE